MLQEVQEDVDQERLFKSTRFNETGVERYLNLLQEAIRKGDEHTLETALTNQGCFATVELKQGKRAKVPSNAAQLFAQSEFNRYYIRAVCRLCLMSEIEQVEVYRARESSWSRPESEAKIGKSIVAKDLLEDLRLAIGAAPKLLPEVNSGLSIRIIS